MKVVYSPGMGREPQLLFQKREAAEERRCQLSENRYQKTSRGGKIKTKQKRGVDQKSRGRVSGERGGRRGKGKTKSHLAYPMDAYASPNSTTPWNFPGTGVSYVLASRPKTSLDPGALEDT